MPAATSVGVLRLHLVLVDADGGDVTTSGEAVW
jgi:hypothetical protein